MIQTFNLLNSNQALVYLSICQIINWESNSSIEVLCILREVPDRDGIMNQYIFSKERVIDYQLDIDRKKKFTNQD